MNDTRLLPMMVEAIKWTEGRDMAIIQCHHERVVCRLRQKTHGLKSVQMFGEIQTKSILDSDS